MPYRFVAKLGENGKSREVSLDYRDRRLLDEQLAQIDEPLPPWPGRLYEFRNERGDLLAFAASAYVAHRVEER